MCGCIKLSVPYINLSVRSILFWRIPDIQYGSESYSYFATTKRLLCYFFLKKLNVLFTSPKTIEIVLPFDFPYFSYPSYLSSTTFHKRAKHSKSSSLQGRRLKFSLIFFAQRSSRSQFAMMSVIQPQEALMAMKTICVKNKVFLGKKSLSEYT